MRRQKKTNLNQLTSAMKQQNVLARRRLVLKLTIKTLLSSECHCLTNIQFNNDNKNNNDNDYENPEWFAALPTIKCCSSKYLD